jgi:ketosteroid isomerase-like protein
MEHGSSQATLRALLDREAIRDLVARYAHCVWRKDVNGAVSLFAEDGEMDTGDRPAIRGRAALLAEYGRMITGPQFQPFVHNHLIELHGDTATGMCYLDLRATVEGTSMIGSGYYDDRYVRVGGEWKFQWRKLTMDYFVPLRDGWAEQPQRA